MPTVSTPTFTAFAASEGRTRSLSDLGVTLPDFVSPHLLEDALRAAHNDLVWKVDRAIRVIETSVRDIEANVERRLRDTIMSQVRDEFCRECDDIRRQVKGKGSVISDQSTKTTTPPPVFL